MRTHLAAACLTFAAAAVAQRDPLPSRAEREAAATNALAVVVDRITQGNGGPNAAAQLRELARAIDSAPERFVLLGQAHRAAVAARDVDEIVAIADETIARFAVDPVDWLAERVAELREVGVVDAGAAAAIWLGRLDAAPTDAIAAGCAAHARDAGAGIEDRALAEQVGFQVVEALARRALAAAEPALFDHGAEADPLRCLTNAAICSKRAGACESATDTRLWQREAFAWYGAAWPDVDALERARITGRMQALNARIASSTELGQVRFADASRLDRLVLQSGAWQIEDGVLHGRNLGEYAYATLSTAFRRIRSVTIRGGIASPDGLNFRVAVGPFNTILNWEVADENHCWIGDRRTVRGPRRLVAGQEHEIAIHDLGGRAVLFVDREPLFEAALDAPLAGTVCVYPAMGSEIFVREILIDGDVDPGRVVRGPSHTAR